MANRIISLVWNHITYKVSAPEKLVILVTGEVLSVSWVSDSQLHQMPDKITPLFAIRPDPKLDLFSTAIVLKAVVGEPINLEYINECPNGCKNPSVPYCSQCGAKTETREIILPLGFIPRSHYDSPWILPKDWRCPNCHIQLDLSDNNIQVCPRCNQPLTVPDH